MIFNDDSQPKFQESPVQLIVQRLGFHDGYQLLQVGGKVAMYGQRGYDGKIDIGDVMEAAALMVGFCSAGLFAGVGAVLITGDMGRFVEAWGAATSPAQRPARYG